MNKGYFVHLIKLSYSLFIAVLSSLHFMYISTHPLIRTMFRGNNFAMAMMWDSRSFRISRFGSCQPAVGPEVPQGTKGLHAAAYICISSCPCPLVVFHKSYVCYIHGVV